MADSLFPKSVPVTVVTGEFQSGKTVFALTTGYPLERVLVFDNELSSETYHTPDNPFVRVDLPGELGRKYPKGYTSLQFYEAWINHMRSVQVGQYDVIIVDTIEQIEDGLADWVTAHASEFGHSAKQYETMSGLFWGDVKATWKRVIQDMQSRCKMVILIAHMRDEFKNKVRTGKRERKGKETLSELATLELELVRKPEQAAPSGKVLKHRFFAGSLADPASVKPILPTWLEKCTWEIIRGYMVHPTEKDIQPPVIDDTEEREMEKLRLKAQIAEDERIKSEAQANSAAAAAVKASSRDNAQQPAPLVSDKVLFRRKLVDRISELGGDVTNPKVALNDIHTSWAVDALDIIKTERWADGLKLDMSANPEPVREPV